MAEPCSRHQSEKITKQLKYITKDHKAMHTMLLKLKTLLKMVLFFSFFLSGITVVCTTLCGWIKGKCRDTNVMYP